MRKKTLSVILALATAVSALAVCPAATVMASDDVTLAVVGPMTGDNAEYGKSFKAAAQIAVDEWNEKGGVLGQEIKLVDYDDANASEQAASIAEKLVGDDSVKAVLGHFSSGVAMTAAEIYQDEGLALVNGSAAHMDFAKIGDCIYRNNAIYTTDANTMLQIMDYLGVKKFGILNPNTDAGIAVQTAIQDMVNEYGITPVKVGFSQEVHKGKAYIRMYADGGFKDYEIKITGLSYSSDKNITLKVVSDELMDKTNGVVQGMSGCPIIQDDKIVGAVTHVFIDDPSCGYGIFIENMLPD